MRNIHIISMTSVKQYFGFTIANPTNDNLEFELIIKIEDPISLSTQNIISFSKQMFEFSEDKNINTKINIETSIHKSEEKTFKFLTGTPKFENIEINQGVKLDKWQFRQANIEIDRSGIRNKAQYSIINIIQQEKTSKQIVGGLMIVVNGG